ncbi:c-type cytochrome [Sulfurimonas sp. C5]|uniref:c-type cytochrome n=1 Tax=Sulfurimonas sp. C5 TaxID=3036947 RepID=UPI0024552642|nr:c-type cytochrome [Sulfurimonas sp. C5]MDH4944614.1 c-type cytochrome [Sulfurimonas sp. C5]
MKTLLKTIIGLGILGAVALNADANFAKCTACHGANGEKHALGKSQVIKGWKAEKTLAALKGYKEGTYGGAMKGVMKGQVNKLSEADMKALAKYIEGLK